MIPALLITFREVIEATLIVATILGVLTKLKQTQSAKTVWVATLCASIVSVLLLGLGSLFGVKVQELYQGRTEQLFEGTMMLISAVFITWAVFWLHKYFAQQKLALLQKVRSTITAERRRGLFILVFTAVFREGFEIVLFLSTVYLTTKPLAVFSGFAIGLGLALLVSLALFTASLKLPVFRTFELSTFLLVLFAGGLAARGVHEFTKAGLLPEFTKITLSFLPASGHYLGKLIKSVFGWSQQMDQLQLTVYAAYLGFMRWYLFRRKAAVKVEV
ncbi:MAG: Iron permease FTR1 [Candidatus Gottesmanbacteria bacterium GW2011_GWB1_43_11]|uniref:Iron permease FTR1 n=1 Tax=Candidatus Gottesmanbacteria bacterium GW2011_GWB1_43_11 TaxID=1618446 RepID=A0A0G1CFS9_9BACT|nr:MAG: Iron permease FTR1 [Candidatus Gottesmanbacteria bacterium GW2011_GWA1_42_26]KKS84329.1 MAG: Iron permease FTR1 [Candidatus Gottesmanbacteria bacterium GW2011_GWB1_43_11]OGG09247.1 MAG: hypothetical protein A2699_06230 [Candidatus Gottesmanbacteria bacterium RIFCSPHIGHO2_01_FULL_43_15]OGG25252.1 MAG: hypothetical protein A3A59_04140 [Candidatus Gottesmanbacteria bacterium RIFCSPLOWO2_01_FULL_42_10]